MAKTKGQEPPKTGPSTPGPNAVRLLLLDRFSARDVDYWNRRSADLDQLAHALYFETQPQRQRRRIDLLNALNSHPAKPFEFDGWVRTVSYRYSNAPLSVVGSLKFVGGRFNFGEDLELTRGSAFPALYLASNAETAYREMHQISAASEGCGLSAEELALSRSVTHCRVNGRVEKMLNLTDPYALIPVAAVLAKIAMPASAKALMRDLKMKPRDIQMIKTQQQLAGAIMYQNWKAIPVQFGLPSPSQQFAELARAAGYEGLLYHSSKHSGGKCLAIFSDNIGSDKTFVELADIPPLGVAITRLDMTTGDALAMP